MTALLEKIQGTPKMCPLTCAPSCCHRPSLTTIRDPSSSITGSAQPRGLTTVRCAGRRRGIKLGPLSPAPVSEVGPVVTSSKPAQEPGCHRPQRASHRCTAAGLCASVCWLCSATSNSLQNRHMRWAADGRNGRILCGSSAVRKRTCPTTGTSRS